MILWTIYTKDYKKWRLKKLKEHFDNVYINQSRGDVLFRNLTCFTSWSIKYSSNFYNDGMRWQDFVRLSIKFKSFYFCKFYLLLPLICQICALHVLHLLFHCFVFISIVVVALLWQDFVRSSMQFKSLICFSVVSLSW